MTNFASHLQQAAELIAAANALVITAGAGMGIDSGLPDFRGKDGFWKAYPALARAKLNFTEVANPSAFERDAGLAWGFYGHRLNLYRQTVPHAGFGILHKWAKRMQLGSWIFTSNVDGQFQKIGFSEDQIFECHGSIHHLQCMTECESDIWSAAEFTPVVDNDSCRLLNALPLCPHCGGLARPNILMFGDWNYLYQRGDAQRKRKDAWFDLMEHSGARIVVVELGAGTSIPSVRNFSQSVSLEYDARLIRINPDEHQVPSTNDIGIACGALAGLQGIDSLLNGC